MENKKLTLEHLALYLPYNLKVWHISYLEFGKNIERIDYLETLSNEYVTFKHGQDWYFNTKENDCEIKPILRPLSDLTKEIEVDGEKFVPIEKLQEELEFDDDFELTEHLQVLLHNVDGTYYFPPNFFLKLYNNLYKWHFDIHGLIEKGLAIDINKLNK